MGFISLNEVLATAESTIKDATSNFKLLARQWVCTLAMPELGISEDDVKTIPLYPKNFTVPKPPDFRALLDISLYDAAGNPLDHKFRAGGKRIYRDTRILPAASAGGSTAALNLRVPVDVSLDTYSFHLGTNGENVATILVRYYGYPIDEKGLPLIRQEEVLALVFFCRFMWAFRQNESRSEIEQNRQMWAKQADKVKAGKKMAAITPEHMKTIVNSTWMRGIPKFDNREF